MSGNNRRNPHDPRAVALSAQTEGRNRRMRERRRRRQGEEEQKSSERQPESQAPPFLRIRIPPNSGRNENDRRVPAAPRSPPQQDDHGEEKYADKNAQNSLQQMKIIF